jgi:hypothetical protein
VLANAESRCPTRRGQHQVHWLRVPRLWLLRRRTTGAWPSCASDRVPDYLYFVNDDTVTSRMPSASCWAISTATHGAPSQPSTHDRGRGDSTASRPERDAGRGSLGRGNRLRLGRGAAPGREARAGGDRLGLPRPPRGLRGGEGTSSRLVLRGRRPLPARARRWDRRGSGRDRRHALSATARRDSELSSTTRSATVSFSSPSTGHWPLSPPPAHSLRASAGAWPCASCAESISKRAHRSGLERLPALLPAALARRRRRGPRRDWVALLSPAGSVQALT